MRRNRKIKKNSVLTSGTWGVVALIVSVLIAAMVYYMLDSRCNQIAREIAKAERRLAALKSENAREMARWDEMNIPEKLSEKLSRFGLEMRCQRADQTVHMDADGRPMKKSRMTLARARARMRGTELALNDAVEPLRAVTAGRPTLKRVSSVPTPKRTVRR